uniref:Immunoglobulin subtype domain-containing protein n=1 Tax=Poecilia latipinna TaxID=48699 RepID=A0A3B3U5T3_9TELE
MCFSSIRLIVYRVVFLSDRCCDTVNNIQGNEDGSVTISCPYDSQSVNKLKFFCRGNRPSTCLQQAVITSSNTQDGRFRLSDDRKSGIFTVTISSLTLKDSGSYLCGVQRNSGFDVFSAVDLEVKGERLQGLFDSPSHLQQRGALRLMCLRKSSHFILNLFYSLSVAFISSSVLAFRRAPRSAADTDNHPGQSLQDQTSPVEW